MDIKFIPRPGALRFKDENGDWVNANPRDMMFSTVTMMATEHWSVEHGWTSIYEEDESSDGIS